MQIIAFVPNVVAYQGLDVEIMEGDVQLSTITHDSRSSTNNLGPGMLTGCHCAKYKCFPPARAEQGCVLLLVTAVVDGTWKESERILLISRCCFFVPQ